MLCYFISINCCRLFMYGTFCVSYNALHGKWYLFDSQPQKNSGYKLCISNFPYMVFAVIEMVLAQVIPNRKKIMCFMCLLQIALPYQIQTQCALCDKVRLHYRQELHLFPGTIKRLLQNSPRWWKTNMLYKVTEKTCTKWYPSFIERFLFRRVFNSARTLSCREKLNPETAKIPLKRCSVGWPTALKFTV